MIYEIDWTSKAAESFDEIVEFVEFQWNERISKRFIKQAFETLDLIASHPYMFPKIDFLDIRKGNVNQYISFFYIVQEFRIIVLLFWDQRRDPLKLKFT